MSISHGDQIYKEKERQELLHVEQQQTQQREVQKPQEQHTAQVQEQDLLGKYEEETGHMDLTDVVERQQQSMSQQVVAASPLHESVRAEEVLKGSEPALKQQEQMQIQEQQIVQEAQVSEQQDEQKKDEKEQEVSAYEELRTLNDALQSDHDSASPEFQAVREKMSQMINVMDQHRSISLQENALVELYQAAVQYYNTHRGYRWSFKGKRRKKLINRIIDKVQKATVSDETPKAVKYSVLSRIMEDQSPEGLSSKKTVEFAQAQAPAQNKEGNFEVDEYSFKFYCYENQRLEDLSVADELYDLKNRVEQSQTNVLNLRDWGVYMERYQVNDKGEPLTEKDQNIRDHSERFFKCMTEGTDEERKDILQEEMNRIIAFKFKPEMMSAEYICAHYGELREICIRNGALDNLIHASANQRAYNMIAQFRKKDYEHNAEILDRLMSVVLNVSQIKNVKQAVGFHDYGCEDISTPQLPEFAKEYMKCGHIEIDSMDQGLDNDHIYKGEKGYVRNGQALDARSEYEESVLEMIEMLQKQEAERKPELEQLAQDIKEIDEVDLRQYQDMSVEKLMDRYSDICQLQSHARNISDKMQYYVAFGGTLDEEKIKRVATKASYLDYVVRYVQRWQDIVKDPVYEAQGAEQLKNISEKELNTLIAQEKDPGKQQYYKAFVSLNSYKSRVSNYNNFIENNLNISAAGFLHLGNILARYEKERQEDPERAKKLEDRRYLFEKAVKARCESDRRRSQILEIGRRNSGGESMVRYLQAMLLIPGMSDEKIAQRAQNLSGEDEKTRHAEYDRIFDDLLKMDLSPFEKLDTDEKLVDKTEMILQCGEVGMEVWAVLKTALADHMEIPMERREEIWKRYNYLIMLTNLLKGRLDLIARDGYGEFTQEEEPKSPEQASEMLEQKDIGDLRKAWLIYSMAPIQERNICPVDLNGSLNLQYETYQPPKMDENGK